MVDSLLGFTAHKGTDGAFTVTASLTVNYRKPVPLGSTVIAEAWVDRREGRKALLFFFSRQSAVQSGIPSFQPIEVTVLDTPPICAAMSARTFIIF